MEYGGSKVHKVNGFLASGHSSLSNNKNRTELTNIVSKQLFFSSFWLKWSPVGQKSAAEMLNKLDGGTTGISNP